VQSLAQNAALEELSLALSEFLPGTPHPYGNANLSFPAIANKLGLGDCWPSQGNKHQRVRLLLDEALQRGKFTVLIQEVVKRGMTHHRVTRAQMVKLSRTVERVGFKIAELNDRHFLDSLPSGHSERTTDTFAPASLHEQIVTLSLLYRELKQLDEVPRGFAFEKFLSDLFWAFELAPRGSFRIRGEQIDGSFALAAETYLLSARWRSKPSDRADLVEFSGTVDGKAQWSRGLFVSQNGFSSEGLDAFSNGRRTNLVCMNGVELSVILENKLNLSEVISAKTRRAAETNEAFVPVWKLFPDLKR
jgi:hypothetical protein